MKKLNTENQALNGESFNDTINQLVSAIASPVKGILASNSTATETAKNPAAVEIVDHNDAVVDGVPEDVAEE